MFFRKDNIVTVDYIEPDKPSKTGKVVEFSAEGMVILFDNETLPTFIPMSSVSEVKLVKGTSSSVPTTQF